MPPVCFPIVLDRDQLFVASIHKENAEKLKIMKAQTIITEMLLFTETSFAKREFCERNDPRSNQGPGRVADRLEKACWSGVLFDMFPDMFESNDRKSMCVWKVNQAEQFVHVDLGSCAGLSEFAASVDPYFFLPVLVYQN